MGRCTSAETYSEAGTYSSDFSGHLWKQGNSGRWRLQYFILRGTKLSWFMPTSRPLTAINKPAGSIQLDGALAEPIAIGCLSDMEGLGRISMTTADAPAGIPPWGIAVEACGAGHSSHSAQRLVLAADSQKLRDLWLDVIHYETIGEPGLSARAKDANRAVEERAHSLSEWQPRSQTFPSQVAEASHSFEGPATPASTRPSSGDTAQRSQRLRQRQQHSSGCAQPRLLRCFTAHGTRSLVLHNTSPSLRSRPQGGAVGPHRPSSTSRKQAAFWDEVLGAGPEPSQGGAPEAFPGGSGAGAVAAPWDTGHASSRSAGSASVQGEPRISMSEWCRQRTAAGGQPVGAAAVHMMPGEGGGQAFGSVHQECSSPGWSVRDNEAFDSRGLQPEDVSCLRCGVDSVQPPAPGQKGGWRVRDNASFDERSCQDPQQAQQGLIPLPAFEGKQVGSCGEAGGMSPMCLVENWLSSLASGQSSANVNSSSSSSSGLQSAAMAFANASSGSSGNSHSRGAGIGSMSGERAQELLGQYQRLLSSVQSVRQHLQVPEQGKQPAGEGGTQLHDTGSCAADKGGDLRLRVQLGSLQQATGQMRAVLSSLQENRQIRREYSRAQSYQQ